MIKSGRVWVDESIHMVTMKGEQSVNCVLLLLCTHILAGSDQDS